MTNEAMSCGAIARASRSNTKSEPRTWARPVHAAWTPERIEKMRALQMDGLSADQIAVKLGNITRNAVIGKMHRMGMTGPRSGSKLGGRPQMSKYETAVNARKSLEVARMYQRPSTKSADELERQRQRRIESGLAALARAIAPTGEDVASVQLVDLEPHHCRWPVGEPTQGFCGCTKQPGSSYCKAHFERSTSTNIKPHTWAHTIGVTAHKNAEEFLAPEAVA